MSADADVAPAEQAEVGAFALGLLSLALCWWFPYGAFLGACGAVTGIGAWAAGRRGRAALAAGLGLAGAAAGAVLTWGMRAWPAAEM